MSARSSMKSGQNRTDTYLLMGEDVTSDLSFFTLNQLDVGFHTLGRECFGKFVVDVSVRVKTGKLDSCQQRPGEHLVKLGVGGLTVMNWKMNPSFPNSQT